MSDGTATRDFVETLWREFGIETDEHLGAIETLLLRADHEVLGHPEIAALFRAFHSLKGVSRAMDIRGMEAIAHAAENLLGLVRDGRLALNGALASLLLPAVDTLRQQRQGAIAARSDQPASPALLERLSNAYETAGAGNGLDAPPVAADESRELLGYFAQGLRDNLRLLPGILAPAADAAHGAALDAAEGIETGATILGLDQLAENMRLLRAGTMEQADGASFAPLRLLGDVHAQAEILAEEAGEPTGTAEFSAALAGYLLPALRQRAAALADHVRQGREDGAPTHGPTLNRLAGLATADAPLWAAYGARRGADLLLLFADACAHAARAPAPDFDKIVQISMDLSILLNPGADACPAAWDVPAPAADTARDAILQAMTPAPAQSDILGLALSPEQRHALSPAHIAAIRQAIESGQEVYAILAFLERDTGIAGAFIPWLQSSVTPIFNRTVRDGRETGLEFIVAAHLPPDAITQQLRHLDPEAACLRRIVCLTRPAGQGAPAPEPRSEAVAFAATGRDARDSSVRIDGHTVTEFVNHTGEVAAAASILARMADDPDTLATLNAMQNLDTQPELRRGLAALAHSFQQMRERSIALDRTVRRLHHAALELRVIPLEPLLTRMSRTVRDLAQDQHKNVHLTVTARDVCVDKAIVEQLSAPLLHMIRNAIDHGIEPPAARIVAGKDPLAQLALRVVAHGSEILIEIADDGRGLDPGRIRQAAIARGVIGEAEASQMPDAEAIRLIFQPGFSTSEAITEWSGRGVGMDVALTTVSRLGGSIDIDSRSGLGTTFHIRLPVSASLLNAVLVSAAGHLLAVPERHIEEVMEIDADAIHDIGGRHGLFIRGEFVRLRPLGALFGTSDTAPPTGQSAPVLVLRTGMNRTAFLCDRLLRRQELYLKDLHPRLAAIPGISGATVLDDGRVVLVVEGDSLSDVIERRQSIAAVT